MFKKRCTAVVLILAMLISTLQLTGCGKNNSKENGVSTKVENTPTAAPSGTPSPTVTEPVVMPTASVKPRKSDVMTEGYTTNGFRVVGRNTVVGLNGTAVFLEHEKTGAKLLYVDCDDKELTFGVALRTPSMDDKGTAHILEHCVLSGSEKYPDRNLFTDLDAHSYTTQLNGFTSQRGYTFFPAASYSEKQLAVLMDVYMDSVLHPLVLKDKNIFLRECRFELENEKASLSANGILFNEVCNSYSQISQYLKKYYLQQLFPNSTRVRDYGGFPEDILQLSYEELLAFHEAFYHPSNMLLFLYGDFSDVTPFLNSLNENCLAGFEKKEILFPNGDDRAVQGDAECFFEEEVTDDTEYVQNCVYAIACKDNRPETRILAGLLAEQLCKSESAYMSEFMARFPNADSYVSCIWDSPLPVICFSASGIGDEEKEAFRKLASDSLAALAKEKNLDDSVLKAFLNQENYRIATLAEERGCGETLLWETAERLATGGDWLAVNETYEALKVLSDALRDGTFRQMIKDNTVNPESTVFLSTVPKIVPADAIGIVDAKYLEERKKDMSEDELKALVRQTEEYREWVSSAAEDHFPEELLVVKKEELPETNPIAEVREKEENGIRYLNSEVSDADTFFFKLYIDANGIPYESLYDTVLYTDMLGNVATENYSAKKLRLFRMNSLTNVSFDLIRQQYTDEECHQYLVVEASGMKEQLADTMTYISEVLLTSDMDDSTALFNVAYDTFMAGYSKVIYSTEEDLLLPLGRAAVSPDDYLDYYLSTNRLHLAYLWEIITQGDEELIRNKIKKMQMIKSILLHSPGAVVVSVGSEDTVRNCEKAAAEILSRMNPSEVKPQNYRNYYKEWRESKNIGIEVGGKNSISNLKILARQDFLAGPSEEGKDYLAGFLVQNELLLPILRMEGNAYSAQSAINNKYAITFSYADPNAEKTFEVFDSLGERMRNMELTKEQIDGAVLYAAGLLNPGMGPFTTAKYTIEQILSHGDLNYMGNLIREMKDFTQEDWLAYADGFDALKEKGKRLSVSDAVTIEANKALFDEIITY